MSLQERIHSRMDKEAFKNFIPSNAEEARYYQAVKRVKKIKSPLTTDKPLNCSGLGNL